MIKTLLGGISRNDFSVMEMSCILVSRQSFKTREHLMLQKLALPLREDCVLVLHTLPQHPISIQSYVKLLMFGHTSHQPLRKSDFAFLLMLTLPYYCQLCICTTTLYNSLPYVVFATTTNANKNHRNYRTICVCYICLLSPNCN